VVVVGVVVVVVPGALSSAAADVLLSLPRLLLFRVVSLPQLLDCLGG
jgi:hypothetical protein